MLHRVEEGTGPRVVLVHGFTQTLRSWDPLAARLATRRSVARVDLPGHGGSAPVRLDFVETTAALSVVGGKAAYVGYSLGGRLCLRLALDRPELVTALVLVGASPGLADPVERAARREADEVLAAAIERDGTAAFLERWLATPLFAGLRPAPADLAARRANPPRAWPPPSASSAPASRIHCGTASARSPVPSSSWPAPRTPSSRPWPDGWRRKSAPPPRSP